MEDRHCDMCKWFVMLDDDDELGICTMFTEDHFPTDGDGCSGWEYWKDSEHDDH